MNTFLRILPMPDEPVSGPAYNWLIPPYATDPPITHDPGVQQRLRQGIPSFPDEAVYVFSLDEQRLLYAKGFKNILGFEDNEVTMRLILGLTAPQHASFVHDVQRKALQFIRAGHQYLDQYVFVIEMKKLHKSGYEVPLETRLSVYESKNNIACSIIGRIQLAPHLRFGQVVRYAVCGPDQNLLEEALSRTEFIRPAISAKEREALLLVAKGSAFKEVAHHLGISHSAVEKRILPLYKRFGVRSLAHLVGYAYENGILP